jgi:hypothetical protein
MGGNEIKEKATSCHFVWFEIKIIVLLLSYGICKNTFIHTVQNIVTYLHYAGHPLPRGAVTGDTAVTTQL